MIIFVYDILIGYIMFSIIDFIDTKVKESGEPVHTCIGFAWIRRLRVRYLEYWHPV